MSNHQNQSTEDGPAETLAVAPGSPLWLIAAERIRQQNEEGWAPEHDDTHNSGEMAAAAGCYALPASHRIMGPRFIDVPTARGLADPDSSVRVMVSVPIAWPWDAEWWKPKPDDRKREIIKACALLLAEYERLSRAEALANTASQTAASKTKI
jgi:hypothetical protein